MYLVSIKQWCCKIKARQYGEKSIIRSFHNPSREATAGAPRPGAPQTSTLAHAQGREGSRHGGHSHRVRQASIVISSVGQFRLVGRVALP